MPPDFSVCADMERPWMREATTIPPRTAMAVIAVILMYFIAAAPLIGFIRLRRELYMDRGGRLADCSESCCYQLLQLPQMKPRTHNWLLIVSDQRRQNVSLVMSGN